jgi:hypothetical protein
MAAGSTGTPADQPAQTVAPDTASLQTTSSRSKRWWDAMLLGVASPFRVIGGTFLFFLVLGAGAAAVLFFSAAQFQSRVAELTVNGTSLTIWRVQDLGEAHQSWIQRVRAHRRLADIAKEALIRAEAERDWSNDELTAATRKHLTEIARFGLRFPNVKSVGADKREGQVVQVAAAAVPDDVDAALLDVERQVLLTTTEGAPARLELNALRKEYETLRRHRETNADLQRAVRNGKNELAAREAELKSILAELSRLFGLTTADIAIGPDSIERVVNVTSELQALKTVWGGQIYTIATWTNDMLVLLLVISMGILGSALNLLASFVANEGRSREESLSFGEYPLRLAFGAVTAIVVFIIAKAGIPILADTAKIGGAAPINPYFISFLAIVSGLMSDRALLAIRNVAGNLLRSANGVDLSQRYTRLKIDELVKDSGRAADTLASLLGMTSDQVTELFSGRTLVTPEQQRLIAAYFARQPRDLFSDLPAAG